MKVVNTPESREGNLIRYLVYFVSYLLAAGVVKLVTLKNPLRVWDIILFVLVAAMVLLFYIYRFNREQRFFESRKWPWLGDLGLIIGLTLLVTGLRVLVMYLQTYKYVNLYGFQEMYLKQENIHMFWFLIVAEGIVMPILQEFLATGFVFNYAFRGNSKATALFGMLVSGLIFSVLNFQFSLPLFLIETCFGAFFAWSYLYTQSIWMPIYLAVVSGILRIIMI